MKRDFSCSDSLTHFLSHPIEGEMKSEEDCIYNGVGNGDGDDYGGEETGQFGDKKRRLSNHQVKSLEKIFEVDNKLDPDRKLKVAHDLGLQPRQVAIWFQNRRARWKTKQLERDYNLLKSNYDTLNSNYRKLEQEKEIIIKELVELKGKLHEDTTETKDELEDKEKYSFFFGSDPTNTSHSIKTEKSLELKDGFSDSDSSGVLNEENLNISNTNITSFGLSSLCSSSATTSNQAELKDHGAYQQSSDTYLVNNVEDESCNIFLVDQAPNLCWYFRDHMN